MILLCIVFKIVTLTDNMWAIALSANLIVVLLMSQGLLLYSVNVILCNGPTIIVTDAVRLLLYAGYVRGRSCIVKMMLLYSEYVMGSTTIVVDILGATVVFWTCYCPNRHYYFFHGAMVVSIVTYILVAVVVYLALASSMRHDTFVKRLDICRLL